MNKYSDYIPPNVISRIKYSNDEELLKAAKKLYIIEIEKKRGGKKFLDIMASKYDIDKGDIVDALSTVLKLSEVYYYLSYLFTAIQSKEICIFNAKKSIAVHSEIFSDFGQPIWIEELNDSPKLWNIVKEDDNDHIFLSYIHMGSEHTYFDPITHVFKRYNETAVINYRLHFDDGIIEISAKKSNQKAIEVSLADVSRIFKLSDIKFKEITDIDIRKFDAAVEKVTYERREGDEASASMTRANNESDTRKDPLRNDLDDREFRKENGLMLLENDVKSVVGLLRGERGKIQIRSHLSPENQIKMFHKIKDIMGW